MNWIDRLRHRRLPTAGTLASTEASQRELDRVRGQWPVVLRYAALMTAHRERNHFAESINTIFRGGNA
jgi:hypothetical protein